MHSRDFVHLDIKHDNILLDGSLRPKLADFGFTQKVTGPIRDFRRTEEYAAPEVLAQTAPFDGKKADIYSMGVVFYSFFMCKYPSKYGPLSLPDDISDTIKNIIKAMLSRDPANRPSAADLKGDPWFQTSTLSQKDYDFYMDIAEDRTRKFMQKKSQTPSAYAG